jgi:nucleotide-binding universal stress UspA family protein
MRQPAPTFVIRRILVALDASPHSLAALEAAVDLAAKMDAELLGLFVEETALLRLAEIPCAREVLYFSFAGVPLTRASMESKLRAQSEQARRALAAAAQRAQVAWAFRTARGKVASEVIAAASGVDLLALGTGGWSVGPRRRAGSAALEIAASSLSVLLLPQREVPENPHLVVYYDGSPAAQRGLLAAVGLARAGMDGITVLVGPQNPVEVMKLEKDVNALLGGNDIQIRYRLFDASTNLLHVLKAEEAGTLVLGSRELLDQLPPLDTFLHEIEMPLLILANGRSQDAPRT